MVDGGFMAKSKLCYAKNLMTHPFELSADLKSKFIKIGVKIDDMHNDVQ